MVRTVDLRIGRLFVLLFLLTGSFVTPEISRLSDLLGTVGLYVGKKYVWDDNEKRNYCGRMTYLRFSNFRYMLGC